MTSTRKALVRSTLREFIAYLRSMEGDDQSLGMRAADNLETTLTSLESDFDSAVPRLTCDIGGKGILDWAFTGESQQGVQKFCDRLWNLIHPRWWAFWK